MNLFRLMYVSRSLAPDYADVMGIMRTAEERNERAGLTGVLCLTGAHFLQVLEGSREAVSRLLGKLYSDSRHTGLTILAAQSVKVRVFPEWSMRLIHWDKLPAGEFVETLRGADNTGPTALADVDPSQLLVFLRRRADHSLRAVKEHG